MERTLLVAALCAAISISFAQAAVANEGDAPYARTGIYFGLSAMGASYTLAEDEIEDAAGGGIDVEVDDVPGFEAVLGYRFAPHFAIEAEFEFLDTAEISADGLPSFLAPEIDSLSGTINAKAYFLTGQFQPYALVGVGVMHSKLTISTADETATGVASRFGGGAEIYLTPTIALDLGVDYLLPGGDTDDLDYVSYGGGLLVRF